MCAIFVQLVFFPGAWRATPDMVGSLPCMRLRHLHGELGSHSSQHARSSSHLAARDVSKLQSALVIPLHPWRMFVTSSQRLGKHSRLRCDLGCDVEDVATIKNFAMKPLRIPMLNSFSNLCHANILDATASK